jgi:hypothetical protein
MREGFLVISRPAISSLKLQATLCLSVSAIMPFHPCARNCGNDFEFIAEFAIIGTALTVTAVHADSHTGPIGLKEIASSRPAQPRADSDGVVDGHPQHFDRDRCTMISEPAIWCIAYPPSSATATWAPSARDAPPRISTNVASAAPPRRTAAAAAAKLSMSAGLSLLLTLKGDGIDVITT